MPKLLQINCDANWGSIGKIAEQLGCMAQQNGWESYIAYGRDMNPSRSCIIRIGTLFDVYEHYIENVLFDKEGLASKRATRKLIESIKQIKPDIIHVHNLHDHYINYELLFKFFKAYDCPVVWTQHDCWAFTGGCMYYSKVGCEKWKSYCKTCPQKRSLIKEKTELQYKKKKYLFNSLYNLTIVTVSQWLTNQIRCSFLKDQKIYTIYNGIDLNVFKPTMGHEVRNKYGLGDKIFFMAAATSWSKRKGLKDYMSLAECLGKDELIVLVGLSKKQTQNLPQNIIAIPRTQDVKEMVLLYSEAEIVLNLSYEETFGLTTAEGFACGTPSIVYNCTASPELITEETGRIVEPGDINGVFKAITELKEIGKDAMKRACRQRAENYYDKNNSFRKYIQLYNELLEGK